MILSKTIPLCVVNRMMSRSWSRLLTSQAVKSNVNLSKVEIKAFKQLLQRSNVHPKWPQNARSLSTTGIMRQNEDPKKDKDDEDLQRERMLTFAKTMTAVWAFMFLAIFFANPGQNSKDEQSGVGRITWADFFHNMLQAGEVSEIVIFPKGNFAKVVLKRGAFYKGQPVRELVYIMNYPPGFDAEEKIREFEDKIGIPPGGGIPISYERKFDNYGQIVGTLFVLAVFAFIFNVVRKNVRTMTANPFSRMTKADFTLVDPQIRQNKGVKFSDVAGLKEAKVEVIEFVDYLKNPEKYRQLGAKPPKGAIMFGPPGCGKTMLAKAIANESNVPFLSMNGSEFIEMIGGLGASRVRSLFAEARKRAPAIIYVDEIDAIGRRRSEGGSGMSGQAGAGEAEQTLNQLLVEMDGIGTGNGGVIMLASTNRPDILDKALLRPGRFDRQITIDLPTVIERKEILEQHMKGVQLEEEPAKYSERLATLTPGFSGADLANLVNEAALHAARLKHSKVAKADLEYAIERVIAGPEKKTSVLGPQERKIVAYHESGHAIVGWMLKHTDALLKVTILPRTSLALGFAQYTPQDKKLYSPDEFMDIMCMALGGRVAESLTFNRITTGAQNDLEKVTKMAYSQIKYFGFNDKVGLLSFEDDKGGRRPYSKRLQATMDMEARSMIAEAYKRTEALLIKHKDVLEKMAVALLERETLNYDDVEALIGPPPFGKKHLVSPVEYEEALKKQAVIGEKEAAGI